MGKFSRKDLISDLPASIIDLILTKLPITDAVKTSILSTEWRYQWTTMTQLIFDKNLEDTLELKRNDEQKIVKFIMRFLLCHDGPINKFKLHLSYLNMFTDIEQWLLLLSKKDIKELDLHVWSGWWCKDHRFLISSCIFSCQKLTNLKLLGFEVRIPSGFQGFPCLKYLHIHGGMDPVEAIESLISGCPLLEKFKFSNMLDPVSLNIRAPNLKHLELSDAFKDVYLEHAPGLVSISMQPAMGLEGKLLTKVPVTFDSLKFIRHGNINFDEFKEALYVLQMIMQSPNLQELQITTVGLGFAYDKATDHFDFWEKECPAYFTFKQLKIVDISFESNENVLGFFNFVLRRSPVLEVMNIFIYGNDGKMEMINQVLRFQRAFPKVEIKFSDEPS